MKYNYDDIEKLRRSLDIVDVVGEFVELKKTGANYKGLCPFHKDTNPSFVVSPSKNISKCFVCNTGGDPLTFYKEVKNLPFNQAVEELSAKYNINIKPVKGSRKQSTKQLRYKELMKDALDYYETELYKKESVEALEYFSKRGFKPDFIKKNNLGYAPKGWSNLYLHMLDKGYSEEELILMGLVKKSEKGIYDTFRHRVMFPILNPQGEVIAFGGRTLENKKEIPKYINSPETPLFIKGENLYGIRDRGNSIRKKNYAILMEGYMDVLAANLYGFDVALAPLGTAFTSNQGDLLKRYTQNIILALDSDGAGQVATEKTALILKKLGFNIRVLTLKEAKDPDEFLKKFGKEKFIGRVKESEEIFDFLYNYYGKEYDLINHQGKINFIERFKEFFLCVKTELEKHLYIDKLKSFIGIDKEILVKILIEENKDIKGKGNIFVNNINSNTFKNKPFQENKLEYQSIILFLLSPETLKLLNNFQMENKFFARIVETLKEMDKNETNIEKLLLANEEFYEDEKDELIDIITASLEFSDAKKKKELYKEVLKGRITKEVKKYIGEKKKTTDLEAVYKAKKIIYQIESIISEEELEKRLFQLEKLLFF